MALNLHNGDRALAIEWLERDMERSENPSKQTQEIVYGAAEKIRRGWKGVSS
jgi:hypothetical protein